MPEIAAWAWSHQSHQIEPAELAAMDVPEATRSVLREHGIPHMVTLPEWLGPDLFTSEAFDRHIATVAAVAPMVIDPVLANSYVVGAVREGSGPQGLYALFVLRRGTGELVVIETEPVRVVPVNATFEQFLKSLAPMVEAWRKLGGLDEELEGTEHDPLPALAAALHDELVAIDPTAGVKGSFWRGWLEQQFEWEPASGDGD